MSEDLWGLFGTPAKQSEGGSGMFGDECSADVAVDSRTSRMNEWIDLDNKVRSLEMQKVEADKKIRELRPRRDKLGQQISEMVCPSDKAMCDSSGEW